MARDAAIERLLGRALTRPGNVLPAVGVVAAGIVTGLWPLYLVGAAVYGVLVATTLFSRSEARRALGREDPRPRVQSVGPDLTDPAVIARYAQAQHEYAGIHSALRNAPIPLPEIEVETAGLMDDVGSICTKAQAVSDYLRTVDPERLLRERAQTQSALAEAGPDLAPTLTETVAALDQHIGVIAEMQGSLNQFDARMHQLVSSLGAIRAEIARLTVEAHDDASARLLEQVGSARELVGGIRASLDEPEPPSQAVRTA